jgi:hypothetical protein
MGFLLRLVPSVPGSAADRAGGPARGDNEMPCREGGGDIAGTVRYPPSRPTSGHVTGMPPKQWSHTANKSRIVQQGGRWPDGTPDDALT